MQTLSAQISNLVKSSTGGATPVLYGGSVNLHNRGNLISQFHFEGLFIGCAAWDSKGYLKIVNKVLEDFT